MPSLDWCTFVRLGGGCGGPIPENRYEHIHVRFSPAILGLRNFLESVPHTRFCLQMWCYLLKASDSVVGLRLRLIRPTFVKFCCAFF